MPSFFRQTIIWCQYNTYSYMGSCIITIVLKVPLAIFLHLHSHDSLLAVHELWQRSHILQRPSKGPERLPSHLYVLQNQLLPLESRTDCCKRRICTFKPANSVSTINFKGAIIESKWRPLTIIELHLLCQYQNGTDKRRWMLEWQVAECLTDTINYTEYQCSVNKVRGQCTGQCSDRRGG